MAETNLKPGSSAPEGAEARDPRKELDDLRKKIDEGGVRRIDKDERTDMRKRAEDAQKKLQEKGEDDKDAQKIIDEINAHEAEETAKDIAEDDDDVETEPEPDETDEKTDETPEAAAPKTRMEAFAEKLGEMGTKIAAGMAKLMEVLQNTFGKMETGALKGLVSMTEMLGWHNAANFLKGMLEPREVRSAMETALGKKGKVASGPNDKADMQTLRDQYQAKLAADGKTPDKYSFNVFVAEKAKELAKTAKDGETYTIGSLVAVESPEKEATDAKDKEAADKAKETKELRDRIGENPEVKNAAAIVALYRAITSKATDLPKIDEGLVKADLAGTPEETDYYYKELRAELIPWLEDESKAGAVFGITLDGGVLEEADGSNWVYDTNLLPNFKTNLENNPAVAVDQLANLDLTGLSLNATAKSALPKFLKRLQDEQRKIGLEVDDAAKASAKPAEAGKPDEKAPEKTA